MSEPIRASGGLVFRHCEGRPELLVVHRPQYDDWSLPKGKDNAGETPQQAAQREVLEETGVTARIVKPLDDVQYDTSSGNDKVVRYFAMKMLSSVPFQPNDEVDEIRWVTPDEAAVALSYDFDRQLVREADINRLALTGLVFLVRHAHAGDRNSWLEPDHLRPLSTKGLSQAAALGELLAAKGVDRILSSPYVRCEQTMDPLSHRTQLPVELARELAEGAGSAAARLIQANAGANVVMCSHGDVIPSTLDHLVRQGMVIKNDAGLFDCKKASVWVVSIDGGQAAEAHYLAPPEG